MRDEVKRMALFGSGVAELTRHRAEQMVKELLESSKQNRNAVMRLIRTEIQNQIASLGLATKRDIERLERRVARLEEAAKSRKKTSAPRKRPAKKATSAARGGSAGPSTATQIGPGDTPRSDAR